MSYPIKFDLEPSNIIIYIRVSTKKQADDNKFGLDSQLDLCHKYIMKNYSNIPSIRLVTDIASSFNNIEKLVNLNKLLLTTLTDNSLIIISHCDRLGRNVNQTYPALSKISLKKSYIIAIENQLCYGINPIMNNQFKSALLNAELESQIKSSHIIISQKKIKDLGGVFGRIPFGKKSVKNENGVTIHVEDPKITESISKIETFYNLGMSVDDITEHCNTVKIGNILWKRSRINNIVSKVNKKIKKIKKIKNIKKPKNIKKVISKSKKDKTINILSSSMKKVKISLK